MNIFEMAKVFRQEEQKRIEELKNETLEAHALREQELLNKAKSTIEPILKDFEETGYHCELSCRGSSKEIVSYAIKNEKNEFRLIAEKYYKHKLDNWGESCYLEEYRFCIEKFDKHKKIWYSKIELCEFGENLSEAIAKYLTKYV